MTTITLHLPDDTPAHAMQRIADVIGCDLYARPDGTFDARPRTSAQGNTNVVKMPRRRHQYMHVRLVTTPDESGC